jgi:rubrerythrin
MSATEMQNRETPRLSARELSCGGCGYGVVIRRDPPACPICWQTNWRERPPLTRFT